MTFTRWPKTSSTCECSRPSVRIFSIVAVSIFSWAGIVLTTSNTSTMKSTKRLFISVLPKYRADVGGNLCGCPLSRNLRSRAADVTALARQDLVLVEELAAETHGSDPRAQLDERDLERVDPCRGGDEDLRLTGAVIHEDLVAEGEVVDDRPRDRAGDLDQRSLGVLTDVAGRDRRRNHSRRSRKLHDIGQRRGPQDRQPETVVVHYTGHADPPVEVEARVVGRANVNAGRVVLDRETLIEGRRGEVTRGNRDRALDGDDSARGEAPRLRDGNYLRVSADRES